MGLSYLKEPEAKSWVYQLHMQLWWFRIISFVSPKCKGQPNIWISGLGQIAKEPKGLGQCQVFNPPKKTHLKQAFLKQGTLPIWRNLESITLYMHNICVCYVVHIDTQTYIYTHRHVYIYSSTNWIISRWAPLSQPRHLNTFRLCLHVARCCTHVPDIFTSIPFFHWLMIFLHCGRPEFKDSPDQSSIFDAIPTLDATGANSWRWSSLRTRAQCHTSTVPESSQLRGWKDMWPPWNLE